MSTPVWLGTRIIHLERGPFTHWWPGDGHNPDQPGVNVHTVGNIQGDGEVIEILVVKGGWMCWVLT